MCVWACVVYECLCMSICEYLHVRVNICACVTVSVCMCVRLYLCVSVFYECVWICMRVYVCVCMCEYVHMNMQVCVYVHMYVCECASEYISLSVWMCLFVCMRMIVYLCGCVHECELYMCMSVNVFVYVWCIWAYSVGICTMCEGFCMCVWLCVCIWLHVLYVSGCICVRVHR